MFFLVIIAIVFLIWFFLRADGDLTLLFKEKYGIGIESLKDKVIWITGASSGIGEALAYTLCSVKAKIILSGTNEERLQKVYQKCIEVYGMGKDDVLVLPFNMSDFHVHEDKFKAVLNHFGKLDILVNNAGRSQRAFFEKIEVKVDKELFDINVFGPVNLSRVVLPHFLENNSGHFVVTNSTAGIIGVPFSATYTGSKHALNGYFECLRNERCKSGINVTICYPGPIETDVIKNCVTGTFGEAYTGSTDSGPRMTSERCAKLMAVAMANKLDHVWITMKFVLVTHYLAQYTPTIFRSWIFPNIPKSYLEKARGGLAK